MSTPTTSLRALLLRLALLLLIGAAGSANAEETIVQYLSGRGPSDAVEWDFFCTEGRRSGVWTKIRVPSCWEQEGFGTYHYGRAHNAPPASKETGVYRTTFRLPRDISGKHVWLVFEGAMTDTDVKVNGTPAGPTHQGGFYQFKYDITKLVRFDTENVLEVSVRRDSANESVNRAERWGDYWNFSGIFRPVYLQILPATYIDRVAIDAKADGKLSVDVFASGASGPHEVSAQVETLDGAAVGSPLTLKWSAGADSVRLSGKIDGVAPWSAETPNLYRLRVAIKSSGAAVHTIQQRFGFRTIEVRQKDGIYVNGQKVILKGANRHSFNPDTGRALDPADSVADIRLIQELNMNAVRMSHYPPDQHFLEACDELGLYVLNELAGWQNYYDTETGRRLIGQMVRRDVNHPSIIFWDNGNEGGWNTENDDEFARWDPQARPVLHPWALFRGVNTDHYEKYDSHLRLCAGPDIYMPTEFLHGLYDGGHGAGMWDYWKAMKESPTCAGGFLWALVDEGIARTDQRGRIDNSGNLAPDGIVGPYRERKGSFYTMKELWSPVQVLLPDKLSNDFDGTVPLANEYSFLDLSSCRFVASLVRLPESKASGVQGEVVWREEKTGVAVPPRSRGTMKLSLPQGWREADVLYLAAHDKHGRELWTWSWWVRGGSKRLEGSAASIAAPTYTQQDSRVTVKAGEISLEFDLTSGQLVSVRRGRAELPLTAGPKVIAYRRQNRSFVQQVGLSKATRSAVQAQANAVHVTAELDGPMRKVVWTIYGDARAEVEYEYAHEGVVDVYGINFELADTRTTNIRWSGKGPYRSWQNRLQGTRYGVWENVNGLNVPGQVYHFPEFAGYFQDWRWARIGTADGSFSVATDASDTFLGLLRPHDGHGGLYALPDVGLAVLEVIPAMRNKFDRAEEVGPQSQPKQVSGVRKGRLSFQF
jgi:hypothetical protein